MLNKKQCIVVCVAINVAFIFAQIYKHTKLVQYAYLKQHDEHILEHHQQTIQTLTQQLHALKDRETIRAFAQKELSMQPLSMKQIKRLPT